MALYLKYRPQDFASLVGQEFIKTTLKAAVNSDKTVGAYLFTGPRGTGKTSTARIFAKAINCTDSKDWNPCGKCVTCVAFWENSLIDIIEIDAASHTGVDNIREIIEKAQFQPTTATYKVYIIDEVHMLSKWAFNALLKILEEPPEHIKFILATTEIHKVPDTILSRCQRYDFRNFSDEDIKSRLEYIASEEKVSVDDESYGYIIKNAEGWMRNAVSLFEQLISDNSISYDHIVETLWVASEDEKNSFIAKLIQKDSSVLDDFEVLKNSWKNLKNFFKSILTDIQKSALENIKSGHDISVNIELLDVISDMLMKSKNSFDESMTFQIGLLKIISWYSPELQNTKSAVIPKKVVNKEVIQTKVTPTEQKPKKSPEADILSSAEDIFASESLPSDMWDIASTSDSDFNSDTLIALIKEKGWKAALVMSLKWSIFQLDEKILSIQSKTKISYNTIAKPEHKDFILTAWEELGLWFTEVTIS